MKQILPLIIFVAVLGSPCAHADGVQTSSKTTVIITSKEKGNSIRPKAPSHQFVECTYNGESLDISFEYDEGPACMSVTDMHSGDVQYFYIATDEPSVTYIGHVGVSIIEITTEAGNIYSGILEPNT